jgi:hypothetical protein
VFGFLVVCASAARVQAYKTFPIGSGTTEDKPQSKLWYHDGSWWGILPYDNPSDPQNAQKKGLNFYRLENGVFVRQSFAAALVGTSNGKRADVLWNGTHLFVLVYKKGVTTQILRKYQYDALTTPTSYKLADGFPANGVTLTFVSGSETATIAQDSTPEGKLWIAYMAGTTTTGFKIRVIWSTNLEHTAWSMEHVLHEGVDKDDLAAVAAFGAPPDARVGVLWSNQVSPTNFGFKFHADGDPETTWSLVETLPPGPPNQNDVADDHIHLIVTPLQDVIAVTKSNTQSRIHVRVLSKVDDQWSWSTPVLVSSLVSGNATRPVVLYEQTNDEVYVFYTYLGNPTSQIDKIVYKKAPLSNLASLSIAPAITVMSTSVNLNDVTSTKDEVDTNSSLVVVTKGGTNAYYTSIVMHAETQNGGSTASTTVATTSANLTGKSGHLYLAAIVTTPPVAVSTVEGLGLIGRRWTRNAPGRTRPESPCGAPRAPPPGTGR